MKQISLRVELPLNSNLAVSGLLFVCLLVRKSRVQIINCRCCNGFYLLSQMQWHIVAFDLIPVEKPFHRNKIFYFTAYWGFISSSSASFGFPYHASWARWRTGWKAVPGPSAWEDVWSVGLGHTSRRTLWKLTYMEKAGINQPSCYRLLEPSNFPFHCNVDILLLIRTCAAHLPVLPLWFNIGLLTVDLVAWYELELSFDLFSFLGLKETDTWDSPTSMPISHSFTLAFCARLQLWVQCWHRRYSS